jgi:hypothetical protein
VATAARNVQQFSSSLRLYLNINMPPTSPWGKKPDQTNTSSSGFPGLKPSKSNDPVAKSQYGEIQEDELIALASIYGDDFHRIETKTGAWKVMVAPVNADILFSFNIIESRA